MSALLRILLKQNTALRGRNGWNSLWQKWLELTIAKMGGVGVIETLAKMYGAYRDKNWWNSLWQKWVELTMAKMGGVGVIETLVKWL